MELISMTIKEELMEYLKDNYLPIPKDIKIGEEFCMTYEDDEDGKPCNVVIELGNPDYNIAVYNVWHAEHLEALGLRKDIDTNEFYADFALSFLHELGHVATLGSLSAQEIKESQLIQVCCALSNSNRRARLLQRSMFAMDYNGYNQLEHDNAFAYWYSPTERIAQEWVVNMLNLFPRMLDDLIDIFDRHYDELFYIEEDEE